MLPDIAEASEACDAFRSPPESRGNGEHAGRALGRRARVGVALERNQLKVGL